jgi:hypothetical protein
MVPNRSDIASFGIGPLLTRSLGLPMVEVVRTRWISFGLGMWLILAPLTLGYDQVAAILHDVALGLIACVVALAAIERPAIRFLVAAPGIWLLCAQPLLRFGRTASRMEIAVGILLVLVAPLPVGRMAQEQRPARIAA